MPGFSYERYGLTGNPFRDLATENLDDVTIFHVNQDIDQSLQAIREEVFDKENRAVIALIGPLGAGKTERLRFTVAEAKDRKAFAVYFDVGERVPAVLRGIAHEFNVAAKDAGLVKTFGGPAWVRPMAALEKTKEGGYDAAEAGQTIAQALNDSSPSFLLLNDLHNLIEGKEVDAMVRVLQAVADGIKPGVLVMFSCYSTYLPWLQVNHPAFAQRVNRTFLLTRLRDDEAGLLLAKKLLVKRVVEDLDPTFPFDNDSITAMNVAVEGNPRRLLELADLVIEYAVAHRAYRIDSDTVQSVLAARAGTEAVIPSIKPKAPAAGATPTTHAVGPTTTIPNYRETEARVP
jgi:hypothetical protein